ncbi:Phosphotransferase system PTS,Mannitol Permease IIBC Component [Mycoplasma mycoides subsp. capri LC str. 95010]|uniref:PTS system mannitol-specific EIICB component n=1 Tax=Mycoplasma mycoides subsp. capri LC str. 95010 TaxID=862259 RepID=F4MNR6_MYCML|nr:PTS transporter subunit EIIC [Mycoplasma mycoides]CBW53748.1 Phosphotransferase system PTS,Mannitol Permease IIBC Component [Mycoplasma mycoides subsp. capri LC str. 95010]
MNSKVQITHKEWANKFKLKVQKTGSFMTGMIMPSIGILLAWGLWTAMFLYDFDNNRKLGWFDVPMLGRLVEPGIKWLLPILIAFNGGRLVYGLRGGMIATFIIVATITGTDHIYSHYIWQKVGDKWVHPGSPNQFIGAMIVGPLSALFLKKVEKLYLHKINPGLEMLVKNFGLAIYAILLGLAVFWSWGWIMWGITFVMISIIKLFGDNKWVAPLLGFFTEPIKVSFLNNALNHGVLGPIGYNEIQIQRSNGVANPRSIFFLYDPNPGPGLGLLLAYIIFTKKEDRYNAAASSLIHTIGGIHEVYFVFIIKKPKMLLATMLGVVGAQFVTSYLGGGTIGTPSPGSLISLIALSNGTHALLINLLAFVVGTLIAFGISVLLLLKNRKNLQSESNQGFKITDEGIEFNEQNSDQKTIKNNNDIKKIVVCCEAGVGSSAMAAGLIRKWVNNNNYDIQVSNIAVKDLKDEYDVVITMKSFKDFASQKAPNALIYSVEQFIGKNTYDDLYKLIENKQQKTKEEK